jgi:hypothetical protein
MLIPTSITLEIHIYNAKRKTLKMKLSLHDVIICIRTYIKVYCTIAMSMDKKWNMTNSD